MIDSARLHDDAFALDPHRVWAQMRRDAPVFHDTIDGVWIVTRHADVIAGFSDTDRFSNRLYRKTLGAVFGPNLLQMDGAPHIALRKVVGPVFAPTRLERYEELLDDVVTSIVTGLDPDGFDLVRQLSAIMPGALIVRLMGLPPADDELFQQWYETMMLGLWKDPELRRRGREAHLELRDHLESVVAERRRNPADDILSRLIAAEVEELPAFVSLLLTAGGETTDKALGNMWRNLLADPDQLGAVLDDHDLLDRAFDETMRHSPSLVYLGREANEDVVWHDVTIPTGREVRLAVGSANRDEAVFDDPDRFDLFRADLHRGLEHRSASYDDGAGHVAFGAGAHFCLGYGLARLEATTASRALIEHFGPLEPVGDLPPLRVQGPTRSTPTLPVRAVNR